MPPPYIIIGILLSPIVGIIVLKRIFDPFERDPFEKYISPILAAMFTTLGTILAWPLILLAGLFYLILKKIEKNVKGA